MKEYKFRASVEMTEVGEYIVNACNYEEALEKMKSGEHDLINVVDYITFGQPHNIELVEDA